MCELLHFMKQSSEMGCGIDGVVDCDRAALDPPRTSASRTHTTHERVDCMLAKRALCALLFSSVITEFAIEVGFIY